MVFDETNISMKEVFKFTKDIESIYKEYTQTGQIIRKNTIGLVDLKNLISEYESEDPQDYDPEAWERFEKIKGDVLETLEWYSEFFEHAEGLKKSRVRIFLEIGTGNPFLDVMAVERLEENLSYKELRRKPFDALDEETISLVHAAISESMEEYERLEKDIHKQIKAIWNYQYGKERKRARESQARSQKAVQKQKNAQELMNDAQKKKAAKKRIAARKRKGIETPENAQSSEKLIRVKEYEWTDSQEREWQANRKKLLESGQWLEDTLATIGKEKAREILSKIRPKNASPGDDAIQAKTREMMSIPQYVMPTSKGYHQPFDPDLKLGSETAMKMEPNAYSYEVTWYMEVDVDEVARKNGFELSRPLSSDHKRLLTIICNLREQGHKYIPLSVLTKLFYGSNSNPNKDQRDYIDSLIKDLKNIRIIQRWTHRRKGLNHEEQDFDVENNSFETNHYRVPDCALTKYAEFDLLTVPAMSRGTATINGRETDNGIYFFPFVSPLWEICSQMKQISNIPKEIFEFPIDKRSTVGRPIADMIRRDLLWKDRTVFEFKYSDFWKRCGICQDNNRVKKQRAKEFLEKFLTFISEKKWKIDEFAMNDETFILYPIKGEFPKYDEIQAQIEKETKEKIKLQKRIEKASKK